MGLLGEFVSVIGILSCSCRMPLCRWTIASLVMFGSGAVGPCREFVHLGGFPMCLVHSLASREARLGLPIICTTEANLVWMENFLLALAVTA